MGVGITVRSKSFNFEKEKIRNAQELEEIKSRLMLDETNSADSFFSAVNSMKYMTITSMTDRTMFDVYRFTSVKGFGLTQ